MSDDRDFDPRFDPAYQRGYQGVVDAAPQARRGPATSAPATPAAQPIGLPPTAPPQPEPAQPAPVDDFVETPARRPNPFIIALVVLSVLLVGGGLYLLYRLRDLFANTQSSTDFDFVTLQVLIGIAPIVIGLGLATALGVIFIYAVRWGRDPR